MLTRFLTTVLIFSLTFSIIGVSASKVFCTRMNKEITKSCCNGGSEDHDCCKKVNVCHKLGFDYSVVNASITITDILLFASAYLNSFHTYITMPAKGHSLLTYNPPHPCQDITVLFRVFRI